MSTSNTRSCEIQGDEVNQGIKSSRTNIGPQFGLDESTVNAHIGQYDGLGPRYGMQPVPFHSTYGQQAVTGASLRGMKTLAYASGADTLYAGSRLRTYAIYQIKLPQFVDTDVLNTSYKDENNTYFFITDNANSGNTTLSIGYTSKPYYDVSPVIARHYYGFDYGYVSESTLNTTTTPTISLNCMRTTAPSAFRQFSPDTKQNYYKTASAVITGVDNSYANILLDLSYGTTASATYPGAFVPMAYSKEINYGIFKKQALNYLFQTIGASGGGLTLHRTYAYNALNITSGTDSTRAIYPNVTINQRADQPLSNVTVAADTVYLSTALTPVLGLMQSSLFKLNSGYSFFAVAKQSPVCGIFQDWIFQSSSTSTSMQYFDPTELYLQPIDINTATYQESGSAKSTGFSAFPIYNGTTPLPDDSVAARTALAVSHYALGEAGTGLLRKNTSYELSFSIFDKGTNVESNVATGVKFLTGATKDFVALTVYRNPVARAKCPIWQNVLRPTLNARALTPNYALNASDIGPIFSHFELRFYYRAIGSFDWLPAGSFDFAQFYYDTVPETFWICQSAIASIPGGQPGAFQDNSPLPKDKWNDVAFFQGYCFWSSTKSLVWSNRNDPFTYPILNSIASIKGFYKGMLEHVYPGQSVQDSRLLVCTSEGIYAGRFNGAYEQIPVRVSADSIATFDRPGSNFQLTFWTSNVAFSSRSCVIGEGVLIYWGPNGLYMDNGSEIPSKNFSRDLEPLIHKLYDASKTDLIHGVFNAKTKQFVFFYQNETNQKALVYNSIDNQFFIFDFGTDILVDSAQVLNIQRTASSGDSSILGDRVVLHITSRADQSKASQTVFFDDLCDSGDCKVTNVIMIKSVSVSGANRRLNFANTYTGVVSLPTSGTLTVANYRSYSNIASSSNNPDGLYTIVGGNGATYIDIAPIGGSWTGYDFVTGGSSVSTVAGTEFPVAWEAEHGFTFNITSQYWAPFGMRFWGRWLYCYQSHKVSGLLRSSGQTFVTSWQSILGTGSVPRTITLSDNSRGNFQVHSQIPFTQQNAEGQAISFTLTTTSGKFCGSRWYMQYLSYDVTDLTKNNFKTWEG